MKRRTVVVGAALLAVAALGVWLSLLARPREPVYRGRALSAWLDDLQTRPDGSTYLPDKSVAAVRAIGPEALPTLLRWLRERDSLINRHAEDLVWSVGVTSYEERKFDRLLYAFRTLGPAARSAYPAVVELLLNSPDAMQRIHARNCLLEADGPGTMRLLAAGLKSPNRKVRLRAAEALSSLRSAPDEVSLPALEAALNDPDPQVRAEAAVGIGWFNRDLIGFAGDLTLPKPRQRISGARGLGAFRSRAQAYLPQLEAAARDEDPEVREAAAEAIRQVRDRESPVID
jgi:hypothetical protein